MKKINVAIAGVGSFTKALVEGVSFYTKNPGERTGLMNFSIGGYHVGDINFVAAFDVDDRKVGKKLHEAVSAKPNVALTITDPIEYSAFVHRGPTLDGVIDEMRGSFVQESNAPIADIVSVLKESKADILINLVPSGGDKATHAYAEAALQAGCSFINCIPTPLATVPEWKSRFESKGLVLLGDDIKSQLGATMLNRFLLALLKMRGIKATKSDQENRGGNADHFNLLYRSASKEKSKSTALASFLEGSDVKPAVKFFYTGNPSGAKQVNIEIEGKIFGCVPIKINSVIEDQISINGAGVLVDAIRAAKYLVDNGMQKDAEKVCPFLMKTVSRPVSDAEAFEMFQKVVNEI